MEMQITSATAMELLGGQFARRVSGGCTIYLQGPLGAGKTTWVRGFMRALGHTGATKSPTYGLVESYQLGGYDIHHFDLYRLNAPDELEHIGIRDYLSTNSIYIVEWPERGGDAMPPADIKINFLYNGTARKVSGIAYSSTGHEMTGAIKQFTHE